MEKKQNLEMSKRNAGECINRSVSKTEQKAEGGWGLGGGGWFT